MNGCESLAYTISSSEESSITSKSSPVSLLHPGFEASEKLSEEDRINKEIKHEWENNHIIEELKARLGQSSATGGWRNPQEEAPCPDSSMFWKYSPGTGAKRESQDTTSVAVAGTQSGSLADVRLSWIQEGEHWLQVFCLDDRLDEDVDSETEYESDDASEDGPNFRWVQRNSAWTRLTEESGPRI
jgi:hypothetical protein